MDFFDDGPEKPVRIWSRIGRRPILASEAAHQQDWTVDSIMKDSTQAFATTAS